MYGTLDICLRKLYSLEGPPTPSALLIVRQVLTVLTFAPMHVVSQSRRDAGAATATGITGALPEGFWKASFELAFYIAVFQGLLTVGVSLTEASRAGFAGQLGLAATPCLAYSIGHKVPSCVWVACVLAIGGALLLGADGAPDGTSFAAAMLKGDNLGDLLCLASGLCWSAYILRIGILSRQHRLPAVPLQAAKALLLCILYAAWAAADWLLVRRCLLQDLWPGLFSPLAMLILIWAAVVPGAFGDVLMQWASARVSGPTISVVLAMDPVFTAGFARLLLGEHLGAYGWGGAGLIFGAAVIAEASEENGED
mmetsp:Transcript_53760/g.152362  ORF Transcript_53760/g.152362 Transcript_53760/m.152362 type:complete len:311 (-) Transcript_53760:37-969(-)